MSIYYKYEPYGYMLVVLYSIDDCVYWYKYEKIRKWFVDTLVNVFHVNFLVYADWFISIRVSQLR